MFHVQRKLSFTFFLSFVFGKKKTENNRYEISTRINDMTGEIKILEGKYEQSDGNYAYMYFKDKGFKFYKLTLSVK